MRGGRRNEKVKTQAKSQIERLRDTEIKKDTETATNQDRITMKQWNRVRDRKADRLIETRAETDNFIKRKEWMNKWWFFGFVFSVIDVFGDDTTQWFSYCSCRQQFYPRCHLSPSGQKKKWMFGGWSHVICISRLKACMDACLSPFWHDFFMIFMHLWRCEI